MQFQGMSEPLIEREDDVQFLPAVPRRALTGSESIVGTDGRTVLDFWRWAHADIVENVQRGVFAEYLVASALGVADLTRIGWAGYDLDYGGKKIEVKSSAYLQSWNQRALSRPSFSIGARQQWVEGAGKYEDPRYVADAYVFCLYGDLEPSASDILDVSRWSFFAVAISDLIAACGTAKSISLEKLKSMASAASYSELRNRIDDALLEKAPAHDGGTSPSTESQGEVTNGARRPLRAYLVAQRKTREHPVIVSASNYREAQLLARADSAIASFGTKVSAFELSGSALKDALTAGARDLRRLERTKAPDSLS